jgi:hypothetical protein
MGGCVDEATMFCKTTSGFHNIFLQSLNYMGWMVPRRASGPRSRLPEISLKILLVSQ